MRIESDWIGAIYKAIKRALRSSILAAQPWVAYGAVLLCSGVFLGLAAEGNYESVEILSRFGYLPATAIWEGGYWALVTSTFVHFELWHVAFNIYWIWMLGTRLERAIGTLPFFAFYLASAFIASSFQLAVSDSTGIGASGVVYAIFGFMWVTRSRYPEFSEALDGRVILWFVVWLIGCVVVTYLEIWNVGNAAHITGLLFGACVGGVFVMRYKPWLLRTGLVVLIILAIVPLVWCPWSIQWLRHKAYSAHVAEQYAAAIEGYDRVIQMDPEDSWAFLNRSYAYQALGQFVKAQADYERAHQLDPSIEDKR